MRKTWPLIEGNGYQTSTTKNVGHRKRLIVGKKKDVS